MATQQSTIRQSKAEKLINQYHQRLREIKSTDLSEISLKEIEELCDGFELEMQTLDSKRASLLSVETRASIRDQYLLIIRQYRDIVHAIRIMNEVCSNTENSENYTVEEIEEMRTKLSKANEVFVKLGYNKSINECFKQSLLEKYNSQTQEITNNFINNILPDQFRDSLFYIERTLAEPELYSLPHLIMWRETAKEKIIRIQVLREDIPDLIVENILKKYESLIKQLQAEILKLRTYPIPEPWGSRFMREGLTHVIKGEFIFFVHPGIEEDMRPLKLSDRDILPGGLTRQEYDTRMNRVNTEIAIAMEELEARNASGMHEKLEWLESTYVRIEERVSFAFTELGYLYRDARSLEYLVNKNQDDELLKKIHKMILRDIRHFYNNRIDISSIAIDIKNNAIEIAPPMRERNLPTASGIDRGWPDKYHLSTPASVIVERGTAIVADKYGHKVSYYRISDLGCIGYWYQGEYDTPVSLAYCKDSLYVCYTDALIQYRVIWNNTEIAKLERTATLIKIPQISCVAWNGINLYVGTLTPCLIRINTNTNSIDREYPLQVIRYESNHRNKNRYPWLQDMKVVSDTVLCLFTGSPAPLQMFSFEGELIRSVITEDLITEAYHFALFFNAVTGEVRFYISDFWDNAIKVFDRKGRYIENICEEGTGLCQISRPTGIFVEQSGYITYCDMKEDNCLQRL